MTPRRRRLWLVCGIVAGVLAAHAPRDRIIVAAKRLRDRGVLLGMGGTPAAGE